MGSSRHIVVTHFRFYTSTCDVCMRVHIHALAFDFGISSSILLRLAIICYYVLSTTNFSQFCFVEPMMDSIDCLYLYILHRFKPPPPNSRIGWRVEFRPTECQLTDFENAALTVFVVMLTRVILSYNLNMLIPISKVDENIKRAQKRDAVLNQR